MFRTFRVSFPRFRQIPSSHMSAEQSNRRVDIHPMIYNTSKLNRCLCLNVTCLLRVPYRNIWLSFGLIACLNNSYNYSLVKVKVLNTRLTLRT